MNLKQNYNRDDFLLFLKSFIPEFSKDIRRVATGGLRVTKEVFYLGESPDLNLSVFELTHSSSADARVALAMDGFKVMRNSATYRALVIYRADKEEDWRLSLMTATPGVNQKGKVSQEFSNPRRFSFFLGPNAQVNTPNQFLIKQGIVKDFAELQKRFSLEVVNKEFYKQISENFIKLVGGTLGSGKNKKTYKAIMRLPSVPEQSRVSLEFAVRLIGRVIFCWFLREKKSSAGISLMPKDLLSLEAIPKHPSYYHQVLESIFFEVLNKEPKSRGEPYSSGSFSTIPYLNGGLFSPQENDYYRRSDGEQSIYHNTLVIPDEWFADFFKTLEIYNFTIDENTSFDEELSIDPEMLGRIFENLLAEINPETGESARKSTGSYYTPRAIVDYMVDESLLLYIKQETNIDEKKIRAIISYDLTDDSQYPLDQSEKQTIIDSLERLKLLDPACGSGAFPIGALQKIVFILQQIDQDGQLWFKTQIKKASPEIRRVIEREFSHKNFDYIRKLGVIRENIYGVDIQPIATEISRLRCFLTLVVDERVDDSLPNRGIEPLPNLDFKFVTANSLIGLPSSQQTTLFKDQVGIDHLKDLRNQFFNATNSERHQLKDEFKEIQKRMLLQMIERRSGDDITQKLSAWDPFSNKASSWFDPEWMFGIENGFSILISNPPYIASYGRQAKKFTSEEIKYYIKNFKTFSSVSNRKKISINTVMLFIEKGLDLLRNFGSLSYIIDQAFLNVDVYSYSRKYLLNNSTLQEIVTDLKFPQVIAEAAILQASKNKQSEEYNILWKKGKVNSSSRQVSISEFNKNDYQFILSSNAGIVKKIELNTTSLGNCAETSTGMQIIPEFFLSNDDDVLKSPKWHKAVFSSNINRYKINWPGKKQKGKYITYNTDLQRKVRSLLQSKLEKGEKTRAPESLSIGSDEKEYRFNTPKIIMSQTVSNANKQIQLQTCIDDTVGYYGNVSIHLIKHDDLNYLKYLVAILNSRLTSFYAVEKKLILGAEIGSKKTPQIRKGAMDLLPIKNIPSIDQKPFIEIADKILAITKSSDYLENIAKKEEVKEYEKQIDQMVYKLYDLTPEEIDIVENSTKK